MDPRWHNPDVVRAVLQGVPKETVPEISLRDLAVGVFLFPGQVLVASRASGRWRRPLVLLIIALLLSSLVTSVVRYPGQYRTSVEWAGWFGGLVEEFRVTEEGFAWSHPESLPYTTRCKRVRLDFAEAGAEMAPHEAEGRETHGVWITSKRVVYWWSVPTGLFSGGDGDVTLATLDVSWVPVVVAAFAGKTDLPGEEFTDYVKRMFVFGAPFYVAAVCIWLASPVLMYVFLFTVMAMILRRHEVTGGFASVFAVNVVCAVPAVCVACAYTLLQLPQLRFGHVFILAFFLYIILAFSSVRRMLIQE